MIMNKEDQDIYNELVATGNEDQAGVFEAYCTITPEEEDNFNNRYSVM